MKSYPESWLSLSFGRKLLVIVLGYLSEFKAANVPFIVLPYGREFWSIKFDTLVFSFCFLFLWGWQPGIQEGAANWDDDWDKFEDAGITVCVYK